MNLGDNFSIVDGLMISIVSMLIIFAILVVISFMIEGFKLIFHEEEVKKEAVENTSARDESTLINNQNELIAVMSAAIQIYNDEQWNNDDKLAITAAEIRAKQTKTIDHLNIKRIKKLSD